jgi:hypothetical protein
MPASHRSRQTALLSVEAADQPFWLITVNNHPAGDQPSTYVIRDLEAYSFPVETGRAAQPATR